MDTGVSQTAITTEVDPDLLGTEIYVALYRGPDFTQARAWSHSSSDLYDWMDRMNFNYDDFSIERVDLV
jgi:hypothetical protein